MTRRRSNGEGTVYRRNDGRWEASLSHLDDAGKRRRSSFYGRTRQDVRSKLDDARRRLVGGELVKDATTTLGAYAAAWVGSTLEASNRKASTRALYATMVRVHLVPAPFGGLRLDRLRASDVEQLLLAKRDAGLSASTRRTLYTVLRAVLDAAVRDGLVRRNAAEQVRRPSGERQEAAYLGREQVATLLEAATATRLAPLLVFLLGTGARRGEALGLHWRDVDLDAATARIRWTVSRTPEGLTLTEPKTAKSRRVVPLPARVVADLRTHRSAQLEQRLAFGPAWHDRGLVFSNELGDLWEPRNVSRAFTVLAAAAGLPPGVGLHTLRHTVATRLLEDGANMRKVQDLLGHSSYVITADVYAHVGEPEMREVAGQLTAALGW